MSRRESLVIRVDDPADGGVSPNRTRSGITCEIRVHYPPSTAHHDVLEAVDRAHRAVSIALGRPE